MLLSCGGLRDHEGKVDEPMTEYTDREQANAEAERVAGGLRQASFVVGFIMVLGGIGGILAAISLQNGLWFAIGLVEFIAAAWITAFSNAIAHLVQPRR